MKSNKMIQKKVQKVGVLTGERFIDFSDLKSFNERCFFDEENNEIISKAEVELLNQTQADTLSFLVVYSSGEIVAYPSMSANFRPPLVPDENSIKVFINQIS